MAYFFKICNFPLKRPINHPSILHTRSNSWNEGNSSDESSEFSDGYRPARRAASRPQQRKAAKKGSKKKPARGGRRRGGSSSEEYDSDSDTQCARNYSRGKSKKVR
jgi:hypothetical protein